MSEIVLRAASLPGSHILILNNAKYGDELGQLPSCPVYPALCMSPSPTLPSLVASTRFLT